MEIVAAAKAAAAEIVVFPEMYSNGYACFDPNDPAAEDLLEGEREVPVRRQGTNRRRPAAAPTTPSSSGKASPYPLLGERPLELGERSENTEHAVVRQPKSLSFTEAASVWMMFVTAYGERIYRASQTSSKRQPLNRLFTIIVNPFTCWCQHVAERR